MDDRIWDLIVIGGGAGGFFGAIQTLEKSSHARVLVLEQTQKTLTKVRISGGGRCNVTHYCFDPKKFVLNYPRGSKELLGPMHRFGAKETVQWFQKHGLNLVAESDGRMFPQTNQSQSVIDLLNKVYFQLGGKLSCMEGVKKITPLEKGFQLLTKNGLEYRTRCILMATGSHSSGWRILKEIGHNIENPVPSLFTFNMPKSPLLKLSGLSKKRVRISFPQWKIEQEGAILLTHWGMSGPVVLKSSAFAARKLAEVGYHTQFHIDWLPDRSYQNLQEEIESYKNFRPAKKLVRAPSSWEIPKKLWAVLLKQWNLEKDLWMQLSKKEIQTLITFLKSGSYEIEGKSTYKEEFVCAGGVNLKEVDFSRMESKLNTGLFFCGEVLDIDGITGGFNFQAAWTGATIAANAITQHITKSSDV